MTTFDNSQRSKWLATLEKASIESDTDTLAVRCKFNFSYFTVPDGRAGFEAWSQENLVDFCEKLREFSRESLAHWQRVRCQRGTRLAIYGKFPSNSAFSHPAHVPHQAQWGRFRLDRTGRLCGFVIPREFDGLQHKTGGRFDSNTFYVVFIDENHEFYQMGDR